MFGSPGSKSAQRRRFRANTGITSNSSGVFALSSVFVLDSIAGSFNGATVTFNLRIAGVSFSPAAPQNLFVVLGGVLQAPTTDYSVSGSTITFVTPPNTNETCTITTISSAATTSGVAGTNGQIIYNSSGTYAGDANLVWNSSSEYLTVGNSTYNTTINSTSVVIANSIGSLFLSSNMKTNIFLNGNMDIAQRLSAGSIPATVTCNTTGGVTGGGLTASTTGGYTVDCWQVIPTGASVTASQNTGGYLALNSLQVNGAASVTGFTIKQRVESLDAIKTSNQQITVQALIWNGTSGSITPQLTVKYPTAADNYGSTSTLVNAVNLQACSNSQWTQVAYTFASNNTSQFGMEVSFVFPAVTSTSQIVKITQCDMQVTPGVVTGLNAIPPPLANRPVSQELNLVRRHCAFIGYGLAGGWAASSTASIGILFPVRFRIPYTFLLLTTSTPTVLDPGIADRTGSGSTISSNNAGTVNGFKIDINGFSGASSSHPAVLETDCILVSCEL